MKSTLETIAFFKSMRQTLENMSDEDAGVLMKALFAYDDGETPDLNGASAVVKVLFPLTAESLDRLTKKRMNKVRPKSDRKDTANEPQSDRKDTAHNHNHNHSHNHSHDRNHPSDEGEESREARSSRFVPPTVDDVKDYAWENGYEIDAERFVDFYASKGWMVGRSKMKDWKAAVRNWAARDKREPLPFENLNLSEGFKVWEAL